MLIFFFQVKFRISRKRRKFGVPVTFSDRNVSDAKDGFVECPSYEDDGYGLLKKELDKGIQVDVIHSTDFVIVQANAYFTVCIPLFQAVPVLTDIGNQTEW